MLFSTPNIDIVERTTSIIRNLSRLVIIGRERYIYIFYFENSKFLKNVYFQSYHSSLNFFGSIFHYWILHVTPYGTAFLTRYQAGRLSSETIVHNRHCSVNRDQLLIVFILMTFSKRLRFPRDQTCKEFLKG